MSPSCTGKWGQTPEDGGGSPFCSGTQALRCFPVRIPCQVTWNLAVLQEAPHDLAGARGLWKLEVETQASDMAVGTSPLLDVLQPARSFARSSPRLLENSHLLRALLSQKLLPFRCMKVIPMAHKSSFQTQKKHLVTDAISKNEVKDRGYLY